MASDTIVAVEHQPLPLDERPSVDHLITENDTPVDNIYSEKQQRLLTEPLYTSWRPAESRSFMALANVGLFYGIAQPPLVPDVLLAVDVELPGDVHDKPNRSYLMWEYGKSPDVVIEIVSNREGGEATQKLASDAKLRVPYYAIHDPRRLLGDQPLRVFRLIGMKYEPLDEPYWLADVGLGLQLWAGRYENLEDTWLRWVDRDRQPIPTGAERAERLAEQLRRLGVEPEA